MKKEGILNRELSTVIARLGHTDKIVVADCGLPVPEETLCIDLSLTLGEPNMLSVLEAVAAEVEVEVMTFAEEIKTKNQTIHKKAKDLLPGKEADYIPHETFKDELKRVKAVIRTGEATPFSNIILYAGVIF